LPSNGVIGEREAVDILHVIAEAAPHDEVAFELLFHKTVHERVDVLVPRIDLESVGFFRERLLSSDAIYALKRSVGAR